MKSSKLFVINPLRSKSGKVNVIWKAAQPGGGAPGAGYRVSAVVVDGSQALRFPEPEKPSPGTRNLIPEKPLQFLPKWANIRADLCL